MHAMQSAGPTIGGIPLWTIVALLILGAIVGTAMLIIKRAMRRRDNQKGSAVSSGTESARNAPPPAVNQKRDSMESYAKRCPTCRSIYADETLAFCLSDGSTLELVSGAPAPPRHDPDATAIYPGAQSNDLPPTVQYRPGLTTDEKE
jgi:hypothetical protein